MAGRRAALTSPELMELDHRIAALADKLAALPDPFCQDGDEQPGSHFLVFLGVLNDRSTASFTSVEIG